jgi:prepilin-type N-terminal cleavage/methylation domain-containing protein
MSTGSEFTSPQRGFSLLEMITVIAIIAVGSAMAIPVTMAMVNNARGDSAMVMTATFLEAARNRAVGERRNIQVSFPANNVIQIDRIEVPSGLLTTLSTLTLENGEEFTRMGVPDTPDALGGAAAINFTGAQPVMFTSDGSFIDAAGDVTNGTIYVARPGDVTTVRAVTIWGVTGMLRTWKWRGTLWQQ